ncbi:LysE family translocator [Rhodococcus erythropolis]|uniref:LysE family translocator n=1 Tax=Rhodococcus erythropolis TaxID=1833 RepID=UPI0011875451|nr:LysE family transporter [Rhodococcus erythropolis]
MVTINQVGAIGVACFVLIVVPGPSVMFVVGRALSYGRLSVLSSVVGNAVGCYTVGVVVAFGLGSLLERFEILVHTIKWAGIVRFTPKSGQWSRGHRGRGQ